MKIILPLVILSVLFLMGSVAAISVNGYINDWGLEKLKTEDWGDNGTWIPNDGIIFAVEDNNDEDVSDPHVNSVYGFGVHIKGTGGKAFVHNHEPVVNNYIQPAGGEQWDVEALYITEDDDYIYVLIITSLPQDGVDISHYEHLNPGDLALDLDMDGVYEYGVKIGGDPADRSKIYHTASPGSWKDATDLPDNSPGWIATNVAIYTGNSANLVYRSIGVWDHGYENYAIEIGIPKSYVGMAGKTLTSGKNGQGSKFHYSEASCGNDIIEQKIEIPEFSIILVPVGIVFGFYYYSRSKKQ
jgi:hypothetical protein